VAPGARHPNPLAFAATSFTYTGEAMPCCMVATPDRMNFGNMGTRGVTATWNSPAYEAFRQALDSDQPPEICRSCSIYHGTF